MFGTLLIEVEHFEHIEVNRRVLVLFQTKLSWREFLECRLLGSDHALNIDITSEYQIAIRAQNLQPTADHFNLYCRSRQDRIWRLFFLNGLAMG